MYLGPCQSSMVKLMCGNSLQVLVFDKILNVALATSDKFNRSSNWRCSVYEDVLKNFAKFTEKTFEKLRNFLEDLQTSASESNLTDEI